MADHSDVFSLLSRLEVIHRKKFTDVEKADILTVLRKSDALDLEAATEPLKRGRFLPKYGEIIVAVEKAKADRLGLSEVKTGSFDAGPEPDDPNLAKIRKAIGPIKFKCWFRSVSVSISDDGKTAVLDMPNRPAFDWVQKDTIPFIATALGVDFVEVTLKGKRI